MEEIPSFVYDETIINMWGREDDDYAEEVEERRNELFENKRDEVIKVAVEC